MSTDKETLASTLRRMAGATAGPFEVHKDDLGRIGICAPNGFIVTYAFDLSDDSNPENDAEAIVAAVNYLRTHGPALEALVVAARRIEDRVRSCAAPSVVECLSDTGCNCAQYGCSVTVYAEQVDALRTALRDMGEET